MGKNQYRLEKNGLKYQSFSRKYDSFIERVKTKDETRIRILLEENLRN